jgi:hypothetical protein
MCCCSTPATAPSPLCSSIFSDRVFAGLVIGTRAEHAPAGGQYQRRCVSCERAATAGRSLLARSGCRRSRRGTWPLVGWSGPDAVKQLVTKPSGFKRQCFCGAKGRIPAPGAVLRASYASSSRDDAAIPVSRSMSRRKWLSLSRPGGPDNRRRVRRLRDDVGPNRRHRRRGLGGHRSLCQQGYRGQLMRSLLFLSRQGNGLRPTRGLPAGCPPSIAPPLSASSPAPRAALSRTVELPLRQPGAGDERTDGRIWSGSASIRRLTVSGSTSVQDDGGKRETS